MYYLWPLPCLLFVCTTLVCVLFVATTIRVSDNSVSVYSVYYSYYFSEKCTPTSQLPIHVSYNSVSVYYFYYYILKLYLPQERRVPGRLPLIGGRNKQIFFSAPFIYTSLCLLLQLALCEGHMYCLWQLSCLLLVCTTLVCVLLLATLMSSISVYYFSMCTVCGHSHVYY